MVKSLRGLLVTAIVIGIVLIAIFLIFWGFASIFGWLMLAGGIVSIVTGALGKKGFPEKIDPLKRLRQLQGLALIAAALLIAGAFGIYFSALGAMINIMLLINLHSLIRAVINAQNGTPQPHEYSAYTWIHKKNGKKGVIMFGNLLNIKGCVCGKDHSLTTREFIVEEHALAKLPALLEKLGAVGAKPLAVYDPNTYAAAFKKLDSFLPGVDTLVLRGEEIHPDEIQVEAITAAAPGHSVLLPVGSGVICDVVSYVAAKLDIPYIAIPTAASVDGFVSNSSAMSLKGAKTTLPTASPLGVVADLEIIAAAPKYLAASGVGDMLSKYISIADWHIGHLLTGEYWCANIAQMELDAVDLILQNADGIARGELFATGKLMEGLLLSGIAMQLAGITRPASSFEHHFSHYLEVVPQPENINTAALHGQKVGIASIVAAKYYPVFTQLLERIFKDGLENKFNMERVYALYPDAPPGLKEFLETENTPTATAALNVDLLRENFDRALEIARELPTDEQMRNALLAVGGMTDYRDIGMTREQFRQTMRRCCYIRNRFTMLRLVCDYDLFDFETMED